MASFPVAKAHADEQNKRDSTLKTESADSIIIQLNDGEGHAVPDVKIRIYDGRNVWRGRKPAFPMQFATTSHQGRASFPGLLKKIPDKSMYWIEFFRPQDSQLRFPPRLMGTKTSLAKMHLDDPLIKQTKLDNRLIASVTLRQECPTDLRIVDEDGKPIHMAQLLFLDDRVTDWTLAGFQDYVDEGDDPSEITLKHQTTFIPEMAEANFIAIREGYFPVEFQLGQPLDLINVVKVTTVLRRAPTIKLSIRQSDGTPAVGAKLTYRGPEPRGPYRPTKPTNEEGMIEFPYPAWGVDARYQVSSQGVLHDVNLSKFIPEDSTSPTNIPVKVDVVLPMKN